MAAAHDRRLRSLCRQLHPEPAADGGAPFAPEPALPGGQVLPLWPPGSPFLDSARVHEPEEYNPNAAGSVPDGVINQVRGVHNPSMEVHLAQGGGGAAVIVVPGGGHNVLNLAGGGTNFVPFFQNYNVSTIVLRPRLRIDRYNMTTDAVFDAQQAIRIVRAHAEEWGLDPHKIGMLGFSAGAELTAAAALEYDAFDAVRSQPPPAPSAAHVWWRLLPAPRAVSLMTL